MKSIVATTDFSENANRAVQFAAQLAQAQQARLTLLNVFRFWPTNPVELGGDFPLSAQAMRSDSQQVLERLANELRQTAGADLPIRCLVEEGHTISTVRDVAAREKADLLVMGTVGSSPQSAQLMGSIASAMVAETTVPLLLIPPSARYNALRNVVLAIDLSAPPNVLVLNTALRFIGQLKSVVNVVCINTNLPDETARQRAEHIRQLMTSVPHTLAILPAGEVYEALLSFAHDQKADLLMMMPQARNWFSRLWTEGQTERMARLTDLPLLAVV